MDYIRYSKNYKVKTSFLEFFNNSFWFIPSDVLQRGIEANIWDLTHFERPSLEIGTGDGKLTRFIFKKVKKIDVGIDNENIGLDIAEKNKIYGKILHASAEKMPFKNNSFNTVFANSTFEHIENDFRAVAEVARVLKKGGLFFITVPNSNLQDWILEYERKNNGSNKARRKIKEFNKRTDHFHYRKLDEWEKVFARNGMEIVFHRYYFKKETALFWYRTFKLFTYKFGSTEVWSILGDSIYSKVLPKGIMKKMVKIYLSGAFKEGFFTEENEGAQLFIIAKKIK